MMIPHSRPTLDQDDYASVLHILKSGHLAQGKQVEQFEKDLSSLIGVRGGVAVSSGTAALHLALLSLNTGSGDEIIIPDFVCTAPLNAIRYTGAVPVIADIDPLTYNIDAGDLKKRLTKKTKAIIIPHMFGLPADMEEILSLGIPVIEDCAQSLGSRYRDSCTGRLGTLSIFSFYATKMIATGEGGMVLSDDESLLEKIRDLRDYDEKELYAVRYNYKMTDFQAAFGISQLKKLFSFIKRRKEIADIYSTAFGKCDFEIPHVPSDREHIFYRYVLQMNNTEVFIDEMAQKEISCRRPVFKPLHRYLDLPGYAATETVWEKAVSLPIYPSLTDEEITRIVESVKSIQS